MIRLRMRYGLLWPTHRPPMTRRIVAILLALCLSIAGGALWAAFEQRADAAEAERLAARAQRNCDELLAVLNGKAAMIEALPNGKTAYTVATTRTVTR
jgi:hypothetical protein